MTARGNDQYASNNVNVITLDEFLKIRQGLQEIW